MKNSDRINQRLEQLRHARGDLVESAAEARTIVRDLNPKVILRKSIGRHPWRWVAGGTAAGLFLLLRLTSSRKVRSSAKKSFTKSSLIGMIIASAAGLLRIPAEEFLRRRMRDYFQEPPTDHQASIHSIQPPHSARSDSAPYR